MAHRWLTDGCVKELLQPLLHAFLKRKSLGATLKALFRALWKPFSAAKRGAVAISTVQRHPLEKFRNVDFKKIFPKML